MLNCSSNKFFIFFFIVEVFKLYLNKAIKLYLFSNFTLYCVT